MPCFVSRDCLFFLNVSTFEKPLRLVTVVRYVIGFRSRLRTNGSVNLGYAWCIARSAFKASSGFERFTRVACFKDRLDRL